MDPFEATRRAEKLRMLKRLCDQLDACITAREFCQFVKENEHHPIYPKTLPPKTQLRPPAPGEELTVQYKLDYLNDLVTEADQLSDLLPRLAAPERVPQLLNTYEKDLEFARCIVHLCQVTVKWKLVVASFDEKVLQEAKNVLHRPRNLTVDQLRELREEVETWEEGLPAVKARWELLMQKSISAADL
ncbi:hypothetical protein F5Y05DRAFT_421460 [Hypoxylon sp. FL0543]|nr:hypothetical protein F5Y05DRAFT_421460 [Hypoxylon sp. FL0543]